MLLRAAASKAVGRLSSSGVPRCALPPAAVCPVVQRMQPAWSRRYLHAPRQRLSSSDADRPLDADIERDTSVLARSYFPFAAGAPGRLPDNPLLAPNSPAEANEGEENALCRVGFGGTARPGNNSADASAAVSVPHLMQRARARLLRFEL
jgi:hypothetical protein